MASFCRTLAAQSQIYLSCPCSVSERVTIRSDASLKPSSDLLHGSIGSQRASSLAFKGYAVDRQRKISRPFLAFSGGHQVDQKTEPNEAESLLPAERATALSQRQPLLRGAAHRRARCKPWPGLVAAAKYAKNDVVLLDERARSDVELLVRGLTRLDMRARQDVALLSSQLQERAKEGASKLDDKAKKDIKRLRHLAVGLEETASIAAMEHWNDGALDADLRLADLRARRRVMEDTYAALESVKTIHNALVSVVRVRDSQLSAAERTETWRSVRLPSRKVETSTEWLYRVEDAYKGMSAAIAEAGDDIDTDELEFIVAALLDMDEVASASGSSLITQASNSPDPQTRRAVAVALSAASSLWQLGNAGMGALERLSKDQNPAVAEAAAAALEEVKEQWQQEQEKLRKSGFFFSPSNTGDPLKKNDDVDDVGGATRRP